MLLSSGHKLDKKYCRKVLTTQVVYCFHSMKQQGVLLPPPPGWDAGMPVLIYTLGRGGGGGETMLRSLMFKETNCWTGIPNSFKMSQAIRAIFN